jgi:hypothetical protein
MGTTTTQNWFKKKTKNQQVCEIKMQENFAFLNLISKRRKLLFPCFVKVQVIRTTFGIMWRKYLQARAWGSTVSSVADP